MRRANELQLNCGWSQKGTETKKGVVVKSLSMIIKNRRDQKGWKRCVL